MTELEYYRIALEDYEKGLEVFPSGDLRAYYGCKEKLKNRDLFFLLHRGLCNYFEEKHGLFISFTSEESYFPVLRKLISKKNATFTIFGKYIYFYSSPNSFIAGKGLLEPRIKLLKKAIKICEKQLTKQIIEK